MSVRRNATHISENARGCMVWYNWDVFHPLNLTRAVNKEVWSLRARRSWGRCYATRRWNTARWFKTMWTRTRCWVTLQNSYDSSWQGWKTKIKTSRKSFKGYTHPKSKYACNQKCLKMISFLRTKMGGRTWKRVSKCLWSIFLKANRSSMTHSSSIICVISYQLLKTRSPKFPLRSAK